MQRRTSASARIIAALALVAAVLILVVAIASNVGDQHHSEHTRRVHTAKREQPQQKPAPATYVIESGDTLTSIAHETGVPVAEIIALNPEVDPQILIAGETLKLR
jgi:LysM repeat protein